MNYRHIYFLIISNAKKQQRTKGQGIYYEAHHILPKSLFPLWAKRKSNIILLTAREHFFCHQLLTKIYPTKAMTFALWRLMTDNQNKSCSSKEYALLKEKLLNNGYFNSFKGKTHTSQVKEKIRQTKLGKNNPNYNKHWYTNGIDNISCEKCPQGFWPGRTVPIENREKYGNTKNLGKKWFTNGEQDLLVFNCPEGYHLGRSISPNKGKSSSDETKKKLSLSHKGKKLSEEHKAKIGLAIKGKPRKPPKKHSYTMTEEHKRLLSKIRKNKQLHWYTNGIHNIQTETCPDGYWPGRIIKQKE